MQVIPGHPWVEMMGEMDAYIVRSYEKAFPAKSVSGTIQIVRGLHSIVLRDPAKIIEKFGGGQYRHEPVQQKKFPERKGYGQVNDYRIESNLRKSQS